MQLIYLWPRHGPRKLANRDWRAQNVNRIMITIVARSPCIAFHCANLFWSALLILLTTEATVFVGGGGEQGQRLSCRISLLLVRCVVYILETWPPKECASDYNNNHYYYGMGSAPEIRCHREEETENQRLEYFKRGERVRELSDRKGKATVQE